jgi:hypothetical protein
MRIFLGSDFEVSTISLLVMLKFKILGKSFFIGPLWGELQLFRVALRLSETKKNSR